MRIGSIFIINLLSPYTPASTSTTVAGNETVSLADEIKKYKSAELIKFLRKEEDLELVQEDYNIIEKERITGCAFLKITEEKLCSYEMPGGPALDLADFAKELDKRKLKVILFVQEFERPK